ncbi:Crp/Fnr family transcriptional regulator [Streptomyces silvensis]|uniref:Regulator n=1 Tax=Streptomyces silvensis TaxID=1765722 RepID=A0A0W7WQM4_9ACTN|nr:cyclic nucleotide-binding domain-containing protein [Streptomyces silvensis]KUF12890.1 regulator [Streptomyces silvensis]
MTTTTKPSPSMKRSLSTEHCLRLTRYAHEVTLERGTRLFDEGGRADWFWVVRYGIVNLDMHIPGRGSPVIETLGADELVGWSWLFPPYVWQLGAETASPLRAYEFDAKAVRRILEVDPKLGSAVSQWVGKVLAHRLQATRTRLLEVYAPSGGGSP